MRKKIVVVCVNVTYEAWKNVFYLKLLLFLHFGVLLE